MVTIIIKNAPGRQSAQLKEGPLEEAPGKRLPRGSETPIDPCPPLGEPFFFSPGARSRTDACGCFGPWALAAACQCFTEPRHMGEDYLSVGKQIHAGTAIFPLAAASLD